MNVLRIVNVEYRIVSKVEVEVKEKEKEKVNNSISLIKSNINNINNIHDIHDKNNTIT